MITKDDSAYSTILYRSVEAVEANTSAFKIQTAVAAMVEAVRIAAGGAVARTEAAAAAFHTAAEEVLAVVACRTLVAVHTAVALEADRMPVVAVVCLRTHLALVVDHPLMLVVVAAADPCSIHTGSRTLQSFLVDCSTRPWLQVQEHGFS